MLIYAASNDPAEADKTAGARELLQGRLVLSVQVLQEFYYQVTRSKRTGSLSHDQAASLVTAWLRFPVQEQTVPLMRAAIDLSHRFQISYWDAAIIEAARLQHCTTVLSEDLSHGQNYDGIRDVYPFR